MQQHCVSNQAGNSESIARLPSALSSFMESIVGKRTGSAEDQSTILSSPDKGGRVVAEIGYNFSSESFHSADLKLNVFEECSLQTNDPQARYDKETDETAGIGINRAPTSAAISKLGERSLSRLSELHQEEATVTSDSTGTSGFNFMCSFESSHSVGAVTVSPARPKGAQRMREKLAEYKADGAEWPLTACILDPVRTSLICSGPAHMLEVAQWFTSQSQNDSHPTSMSGKGKLQPCRIKNKFCLDRDKMVSTNMVFWENNLPSVCYDGLLEQIGLTF